MSHGPHSSAFQRIFPRRNLFRGKPLAANLLCLLGALCLAAVFFVLFLIADLLVHQGRLDDDRAAQLASAGYEEVAPTAAGKQGPVAYENKGLWPTAWWLRSHDWPHARGLGSFLSGGLRLFAALRDNHWALITLTVAGFLWALAAAAAFLAARRQASLTAMQHAVQLRRSLHRQTLRLGPSDVADSMRDEALQLFLEDVETVRTGIRDFVLRLGRSTVVLIVLLGVALAAHWRVALQCLVPVAGCWFVLQQSRRRTEERSRGDESRSNLELRLLSESFRRTRLVRGFGMEDYEHNQFRTHLERFRAARMKLGWRLLWSHLGQVALVLLLCGLVTLLVGGRLLYLPDELNGPRDLTLASGLVLVAALAGTILPVRSLWLLNELTRTASRAADRIQRYLNQVPEVGQAVGAKFLQPLSRRIRCEGVTYRRQGRLLLDKLDLEIPAGETTAILSLDPLEARTLAFMLPRFVEPHSGKILFDGEDIAWVTLESLRAETLFVGGRDASFTGTVAENISCGNKDYSLQQITDAAKATHAHNFILKLPQGYETLLGEHGERLQPGEAFRLSLTRAVLRDPAVTIIEEPDVPLNDDTKSMLDDAYDRLMQRRTVIFLPTRLSTLRRAGRIALLSAGKVAAMGPYTDLVRSSAIYRHWEYLNFNEFRSSPEPVE